MSLLTSTLRALRLPLFCALLWLLSAGSAQASINCTATMTAVAFGTVDLVAGGTPTPATATLSYTCTKTGNTNTTEYARVCFNIGDGNEGLTNFNPRVMKSGAGDSLKFQLYQGTTSTIWGSSGNAAVPNPYTINIAIPARSTTSSGSTTMRGELIALQTTVPPGAYQDNFAGIHTSITLTSSTNAPPTTCGTAVADQFAFIVSATGTPMPTLRYTGCGRQRSMSRGWNSAVSTPRDHSTTLRKPRMRNSAASAGVAAITARLAR